jgi:hypothetical protein
MDKLRNSQSGFGVVEVVLIVVIIALIGLAGWFVYRDHHKTTVANTTISSSSKPATSTSTKTATTTPTQSANPYAGWDTATLQYEKITYQYPSNWTLQDNSETMADANSSLSPVGCTLNNGQDIVTLTAPSGAFVTLDTGVECVSGGSGISFAGFTPINVLGNHDYLAYEENSSTNPLVVVATISTSDTSGFDHPVSQNIMGSSNPYDRFTYTYTANITANSGETLSAFENNPDFVNAKLIFESMEY